jgi:hypothetical protein
MVASDATYADATYLDDFDTLSATDWDVYDSPGRRGAGRHVPAQVRVGDGVLTITGESDGTTGGMKWRGRSQKYGQWDVRLRAAAGAVAYHPIVQLWGDTEIDIVDVWQRVHRDRNTFSVHYGDGSQFVGGNAHLDMTQWHTYHVVWQESFLYTWIDDLPTYFSTSRAEILPPGPMDLSIQLDWFPHEGTAGGRTASMEVDYVAQFAEPVSDDVL